MNELYEACIDIGIVPRQVPTDGKWHQTDVEGKHARNNDGRIMLFTDGTGGMVHNWTTMDTPELFWFESNIHLSPADIEKRKLRFKQERIRAEKELAEDRSRTAGIATELWNQSTPVIEHGYLTRKKVHPTDTMRMLDIESVAKVIGYHPQAKGRKLTGDILIIPIGDNKITSIEMIDETGNKTALAGGKKSGCFWLTAQPHEDTAVIVIGEGVSTTLTGAEALNCVGVAALSCHNLAAVATHMRKDYPNATIIILSDVGNGEKAAVEAAMAVNGHLAKPDFPEGSTATDMNDLLVECGIESVRSCIQAAAPVDLGPASDTETDTDTDTNTETNTNTNTNTNTDTDTAALAVLPSSLVCDIPEQLTDQRIKYFFASLYKNIVQYVPGIGWHYWDGKRWCTNMHGGLHTLIDNMQRNLMVDALNIQDEEKRLKRRKSLLDMEMHKRQVTVIQACQYVPELITDADALDRDVMLFNAQNGTIDLRTGILRPHDPTDLITRIVNIEYDPSATCPTFMKFLTWAMCDDQELVAYLQRFIGYCLTGKITEQKLDYWYGVGSNGKTTLMTVVQELLCDYATTADTGLIMKRANGNGNDGNRFSMLAGLRGARAVTLTEVNEGEQLDEAAIKSFTGGDVITCRYLYGEFFSYTPQAKLIGFGNYKPAVRGTDNGIWRRFDLVPFRAVISEEEKDPVLLEKLLAELPGILAWAVKGCLEWQRIGLAQPAAVRNATLEYRNGEDVFTSWLSECCTVTPERSASASSLLVSFISFSGWRQTTRTKFGRILSDHGFTKRKSGGNIVWDGVALESR